MRIVGIHILEDCWNKHAEVCRPLQAWYHDMEKSILGQPIDIGQQFSNGYAITGTRAVFHIKGNRYRVVVQINYQLGIVEIRFAGTHADYDKIDANVI